MTIEIKKSQNPVKYEDAISFMEDRLKDIDLKKVDDLIWVLEHDHIYTSGTSYNENEIIDKSINIIKTNRGGKITYHGPGQLICYFVIDLKKRKKDIRNFMGVNDSDLNCLKFRNIEGLEVIDERKLEKAWKKGYITNAPERNRRSLDELILKSIFHKALPDCIIETQVPVKIKKTLYVDFKITYELF